MDKALPVMSSRQDSNTSTLYRHRLALVAKLLVILCGVVYAVIFAVASIPPIVIGRDGPPDLDSSWLVALASTWDQGQISGRDFQFPYGPLMQSIAWAPTQLSSSGSPVLAYSAILVTFVLVGWGTFSLTLIQIQRLNWKATLIAFIYLA